MAKLMDYDTIVIDNFFGAEIEKKDCHVDDYQRHDHRLAGAASGLGRSSVFFVFVIVFAVVESHIPYAMTSNAGSE